MTIPIICEECGKLYHIPKDKLLNIKGDMAKTRCRNCGFVMLVNKSQAKAPDELEELDDFSEVAGETNEAALPEAGTTFPAGGTASADPITDLPLTSMPKTKRSGLGLKAKMIVLFLVVPLIMVAAAGYFSQRQTNMMVSTLVNQSVDMVTTLAEQHVADMSKAVSRQLQLYLGANPTLTDDGFAADRVLNGLAVQNVGAAGFTFLYKTDPFTVLASAVPHLNGKPLSESMRPNLGEDWGRMQKMIEPLERGENIQRNGYANWVGAGGTKREHYFVMTPIKGTAYGIAAAADVDEFATPLHQMRAYAGQEAVRTKNTNFSVTLATLIIIGFIVIVYGHTLVSRIKTITDVANRISVGELDAEMKIRSDDELGRLADAITAMQESLRLSIMRLRRRR